VKPGFYAKEEGIFAGGSTDRNVVAALAIAKELGAENELSHLVVKTESNT
jgi:cysteine synthase